MEWNEDAWFREISEPMLKDVRNIIAAYINAQSGDDLVFVQNASDGFNAAIKGFDWKKGDKILRTNIA